MGFHENLRLLRQQKGLKQKEVADILKMPHNIYNGYETGKRMPNIQLLKELSILFKVSVDYLINSNYTIKNDICSNVLVFTFTCYFV